MLNDILLTVYTIQICKYRVVGHMTPYKIKKECYLLRSCLTVEPVFLLMGEVWLMHNADTQCTVEGRVEVKGQRKFFMFKCFLSCHKI